MRQFDTIVIGGGLVGAAIGYGLARAGLTTAMIDEGDVAFRASRGNFGLVWVQSKGLGAPHYQRWTRLSAEEWPALANDLALRTGISVGLEQPGGLQLCLGEEELNRRHAVMEQMRREAGNFGFEYRMLDHKQLTEILPGLGPSVAGAMTGMPTRSICCTRCTRAFPRKAAPICPTARSARHMPHRTISASNWMAS